MAKQYNYNDRVPTQYYQAFAKAAGCGGGSKTTGSTVFSCLVNADTAVLQNASATVSTSGEFGTFAFLPVTDGHFIQAAPSQQLLEKAVSGKRLLVGVRPIFPRSSANVASDRVSRTMPMKALRLPPRKFLPRTTSSIMSKPPFPPLPQPINHAFCKSTNSTTPTPTSQHPSSTPSATAAPPR